MTALPKPARRSARKKFAATSFSSVPLPLGAPLMGLQLGADRLVASPAARSGFSRSPLRR